MADISNISNLLRRFGSASNHFDTVKGRTGRIGIDGNVEPDPRVPGLPNRIYVRIGDSQQATVVWNYAINDLVADAPVRLRLNEDGEFEVVGLRPAEADAQYGISAPTVANLPTPPESSPQFVDGSRFMPLRPFRTPGNPTSLTVAAGWINGKKFTESTIIPTPTSTASSRAFVYVGVDRAALTLVQAVGNVVASATTLTQADVDARAYLGNNVEPVAAIDMTTDQFGFEQSDIIDLRGFVDARRDALDLATLFVATNGNDSNSGLTQDRPKATISAAITAAASGSTNGTGAAPSTSNRIRVEILDSGVYTEDVTTESNVDLIGMTASIVGTVQMKDGVSVWLREITETGNNQKAIFKTSGNSSSYAFVDRINVSGNGSTAVDNQAANSIIVLQARQVWVGDNGIGIGDASVQIGHIHFLVGDLYLNGDNAIGIEAANTASNIIGYVDHILETGTHTGTKAIDVGGSGRVFITASQIIADTAVEIASGGELAVTCPIVTGTVSNAGTIRGMLGDTLYGPVTLDGQPTIDDYTNANHDHSNAANGGTLASAAIPWESPDGIIGQSNQVAGYFSDLRIDGAVGTLRTLQYTTSGVLRWRILADSASESGSNAGSDLRFTPYDDAGNSLGVSAIVTRAAGNWLFPNNVKIGAGTAPNEALDIEGNMRIDGPAPYIQLYQSGVLQGQIGIDFSTSEFYIGNDARIDGAIDVSGAATIGGLATINNRLDVYRAVTGGGGLLQIWQSDEGGTQTTVARVQTDGDIQNVNNSYGAISDEKYKSNIRPAPSYLSDLMQVKVRKFENDLASGETQLGVVAQEIETIFPRLVEANQDPTDDTQTAKSVKYSVLSMIAMKALQELKTEVDNLEARITALEGI